MEKADEVFGCFRCGSLDVIGDTDRTIIICDECGQRGVVSVETALDIINNLYLDKELPEGLMALIDGIDQSDFCYQGVNGDGVSPPIEAFDDEA